MNVSAETEVVRTNEAKVIRLEIFYDEITKKTRENKSVDRKTKFLCILVNLDNLTIPLEP